MKGSRALSQMRYVVGRDRIPGLFWVLGLTIAVAFLELVSIGGLFPLLSVLFDPSGGASTAIERFVRTLGLYPEGTAGTVRFAVALLALFVLKVGVTAYALKASYRFSYDVQVDIGHRLLQGLLSRDYEYFLTQNSSVLLKTVTSEVLLIAGGILIPLLSFVTQLLIVLTIVAVVASISPVTALVTFALVSLLIGGLYALLNRKLSLWGKLRETRLADMHRLVHQAISGVKMVKTHGSEAGYLSGFRRVGDEYATLNARYQVATATPPLLMELMLFGGMMSMILIFAWRQADLVRILPVIGVFGIAIYRVLPAARKAFADLVTMRYYWPSLDVVAHEMRAAQHYRPVAVPSGNAPACAPVIGPLTREIVLDDVHYRYPGTDRDALAGISLSIAHGSHIAIVGTSGAGKSTLVDIILGLLAPDRGRVAVDGVAVGRANLADWLAQIGYVPQHVFIADATLGENVAFGLAADEIDSARIEDVLRSAQLGELLERLPDRLDTRVGENGARLSGGERQRLGIARALYRDPRLLVLDEATSALDTLTERAVNTDVLESCAGITVVIVAHRLSTVRRCDRLILLEAGRIERVGSYDDLIRDGGRFAEMHRQSVSIQ